jgi:hypothetical protein
LRFSFRRRLIGNSHEKSQSRICRRCSNRWCNPFVSSTSSAQLQTDNQNLSNRLAAAADSKSLSDEQLNELLKLRGEVGVLRQRLNELQTQDKKIREVEEKFHISDEDLQMTLASAKFAADEVSVVNTMKQLGLAERLYAGDHNEQYATNFDQMKDELGGL